MPAVTFSGIASGIDGEAIIKAITDARRVSLIPFQNKIAFNQEETTALEEVNKKLLALQDAVDEFRTFRGAAVKKSATSSNEDILEAVAGQQAIASNFDITVHSLAQAGLWTFDDRFADKNQPIAPNLAAPSQITILVGTGADQSTITVDVTNETTLSGIVDQINTNGSGKALATLVNVNTPQAPEYALMINSQEMGVSKGTLAVTVGQEIKDQGLFNSYTEQAAADSHINVVGLGDIIRSTNTIADLIQGLTLKLKTADPTTPVRVSVAPDTAKTKEKLQAVITAFNDLVRYSNENSLVEVKSKDNGESENVYGSLAKTRVDNMAITSIRSALHTSSATTNSIYRIFADLGVDTDWRDGTIEFKEDEFDAAMAADPVAVDEMLNGFADKVGRGGSGVLAEFTKIGEGIVALATNANTNENKSLNEKIERVERIIASEEGRLKKMFAALERRIGQLNVQGNALTSVLASLNTSGR